MVLIWPHEITPPAEKHKRQQGKDGHTEHTLRLGLHPSCLQAACVGWGVSEGDRGGSSGHTPGDTPDKIDSTGPIIPPEIPQNGCLTGYVMQTQPQSLRSSPLDSTQSTHPCSYSTIYFLTRTTCRPVSWIPRHEISIWPPKADRHLQTTTAD
jgi:hypothetical protein